MPIRQLSETVVNRIAAGEVIERPASVVKELVENALDAGAGRIEIATAGGGKSLIRVIDDGSGMDADELPLAVSRHCTSKLGDDLLDIRTLGFRGEALPSIGSVARLTIRSRPAGRSGAEIEVDGGHVAGPRPAAGNAGTLVEVRDLFFATPARLKFLKSDRAEAAAITDVVRRIAIAFPGVRFTLSGPDRSTLDLPATDREEGRRARVAAVLGSDFEANAVDIFAERDGVTVSGLASVASHTRAGATHQFAYVNGRPVRDKLILGAIRGAYADLLPRDRHPEAAIFIGIDPALVDVNVHPAKADVRFRDPGLVRMLVIGAIRDGLRGAGIRTSSMRADAMTGAFRPGRHPDMRSGHWPGRGSDAGYDAPTSPFRPYGFAEGGQTRFETGWSADSRASSRDTTVATEALARPLGAARAQVHENYVIAQTEDSLVIVDQHAAHERLVYEALKTALASRPMPSQLLLIPEIIDMAEDDVDRLAVESETFARFGLQLERFGPGAVAVRATPALLGEVDAAALVRDIADRLAEGDGAVALAGRLDAVAASMACHGSVRSGRRLRPEEMDALLRQMEATPGSGTCNHGRPTYIELKLADIERLFGRR